MPKTKKPASKPVPKKPGANTQGDDSSAPPPPGPKSGRGVGN